MSTRHLKLAFAILLVLVAIRLLWNAGAGQAPLAHATLPVRVAFDIVLGAAVGLLAGVLGVGGGILAVPAFTLLLGMSQQQAQGTSLALILFAAPAGALEHARRGNVVGRLAIWLGLGSVAGAVLASTLVQAAPGPLLTRAFAVFLLGNALPMGYLALRSHPTAEGRT
ncbi:MAG: sulfite exporter TauE/SafE family protein [Candidatus Eisenbacteria bacterium]